MLSWCTSAQNCGRNVGLDRFKLSEHNYPTSGPAGLKSGLAVCPLHSWNCDFAYMYGCLSLESLAWDSIHHVLRIHNAIFMYSCTWAQCTLRHSLCSPTPSSDKFIGTVLELHNTKRKRSWSTLVKQSCFYLLFNCRKRCFWAEKNYKWAYVELRIKKWKNRFLHRNYLFLFSNKTSTKSGNLGNILDFETFFKGGVGEDPVRIKVFNLIFVKIPWRGD